MGIDGRGERCIRGGGPARISVSLYEDIHDMTLMSVDISRTLLIYPNAAGGCKC